MIAIYIYMCEQFSPANSPCIVYEIPTVGDKTFSEETLHNQCEKRSIKSRIAGMNSDCHDD